MWATWGACIKLKQMSASIYDFKMFLFKCSEQTFKERNTRWNRLHKVRCWLCLLEMLSASHNIHLFADKTYCYDGMHTKSKYHLKYKLCQKSLRYSCHPIILIFIQITLSSLPLIRASFLFLRWDTAAIFNPTTIRTTLGQVWKLINMDKLLLFIFHARGRGKHIVKFQK